MSQARLPRTEPSTELITAHKVNHRAAHVAGRALGIFAKVRSHRVLQLAEVKRLPRAKNEIWYQRIPDPQQRPEGDQGS